MILLIVSVIIPVYNTKLYLTRCINSIIKQKNLDVEIILIDDGSNDGSSDICDQFALIDSRIKVIHKENQGASIARNTGLEIANGKYIWFIDSDDYIESNALKELVNLLKFNSNLDVVTCSHYNVYLNKNKETVYLPNSSLNIVLNRRDYLSILSNNNGSYWAPWKNIYKSSILKENNIMFNPSLVGAEDCDLYMRVVEKSNYFMMMKQAYVNYQIDREGSITNSLNYKTLLDRLKVYNKYYKKYSFSNDNTLKNLKFFFSNKFANAISEIHLLSDITEVKKIENYISKNKIILNYLRGIKYYVAKFFWRFFGFYRGSKYLYFINSRIIRQKIN